MPCSRVGADVTLRAHPQPPRLALAVAVLGTSCNRDFSDRIVSNWEESNEDDQDVAEDHGQAAADGEAPRCPLPRPRLRPHHYHRRRRCVRTLGVPAPGPRDPCALRLHAAGTRLAVPRRPTCTPLRSTLGSSLITHLFPNWRSRVARVPAPWSPVPSARVSRPRQARPLKLAGLSAAPFRRIGCQCSRLQACTPPLAPRMARATSLLCCSTRPRMPVVSA